MEFLDKFKPLWILVTLAAVCVVLGIVLAMTGPHDWGDVPTWLATVGTLGSLWVALGIYYWTVREGRFAPARLVAAYNVRTESVSRSQAVNVWHSRGYNNPMGAAAEDPNNVLSPKEAGPVVQRLMIAVDNRSEYAIHSIRIELGFPDGSSIRPVSGAYASLRPHGKLLPIFHFEKAIDISGIRPWVFFTDSAGRRWAAKSGSPVRPAGANEGIYDGDGTLDFLARDLEAHEGVSL